MSCVNEPLGLVVFSKAGRDKRKPFVVVGYASEREGEYYYLADGDKRRITTPKKKKIKHVQPTRIIVYDIRERIAVRGHRDAPSLDAEIRKVLMPYVKEKGVTELVEG